ncbi:hypothetical protein JHK86_024194 [Glycine max]|nr:hypothetical protein JHK86_024194 [Glycine max]
MGSFFLFSAISPRTITIIEQRPTPPNHKSRWKHTTTAQTQCTTRNHHLHPSSDLVHHHRTVASFLSRDHHNLQHHNTHPLQAATKSSGSHSFSALSKKVITHLGNSKIQLHPGHAAEFTLSNSDPILRK